MAIERHFINGDTADERIDNIASILTENAVPKYFDSVEVATDDSDVLYVSCVKNEVEILKIYNSLANVSSAGIIVATSNSSYKLTGGSQNTLNLIWTCENGIFFSIKYTNQQYRPTFTISLDENGNTCFVFTESFAQPSVTSINVRCLSTDVTFDITSNDAFKPFSQQKSHGYLTALCPIPVLDTEHYLQNVFLMPFCSDVSSNIIEIDGTRYISNGLWCVKD